MKEHTISVTEHDAFVDRLHDVTQAIRVLEETREAIVRDAREAGVPWQSIAIAVGITRQGAQQKFGRVRPDPDQMAFPIPRDYL